jgi:hypothetical protein
MISFREDEGAGEHCSEGALTLLHQRTFDWVDRLMTGVSRPDYAAATSR